MERREGKKDVYFIKEVVLILELNSCEILKPDTSLLVPMSLGSLTGFLLASISNT